MTTATGNYPFDNSSLTNFKTWAMGISSAFSTFGWVQTTDTGQVNWSTISSVPSGFVYEVWKANDTLASTLPIFVLVQYGTGTTPKIQLTVGTGSNGSGTITGQVITGAPWVSSFSTAQGATLFPSYFSGSAGEMRMWLWPTPNSTPATGFFFAIERSKDGSGNNTASYFTCFMMSQSTAGFGAGCWQQTILPTGVGNRDNGIVAPTYTSTSGTGSAFGTVAALPVLPIYGQVGNPALGIMAIAAADAAVNSTVTVTSMYGSTHTFIVVGNGTGTSNISAAMGTRGTTACPMAALMRYE